MYFIRFLFDFRSILKHPINISALYFLVKVQFGNSNFRDSSSSLVMDFSINVMALMNLFLRTSIPLEFWIFINELRHGINSQLTLLLLSKISNKLSSIFSSVAIC